jgi:phosphoribosyl 1,2-cyclic phosphate phosphodiesterase
VKVTVLGSGTSTGVPRIGDYWGACDPEEPRNRRTRVSIAVENDAGQRVLVDTSPDLRAQLLANRIDRIDAVFWTHDHADHCHGIDDLRPLRFGRSAPIPGYAGEETARRLRARFGYVFAGEFGYPTIVDLHRLEDTRMAAGFAVESCRMPHGPAMSTAFRFEADGKAIGYATDFSEITDEMVDILEDVDILISDCLRRNAHPTHANLQMALDLAKRTGAGRTILTHLDSSMDYRSLSREVPADISVGFDGMVETA